MYAVAAIRVIFSMPPPPAGPVPARMTLRDELGGAEGDDLRHAAAKREPEEIDLVEAEGG